MKKILFHIRRSFKLLLMILIVTILAVVFTLYIYKPTYAISYKGIFLGYSRNIFNIKNKLHQSIFEGDEEAAYYEIDEKPTFEFKFMKSKYTPDDEKIVAELKQYARPVYKSYAVKEDGKIKANVSSYKEAQSIIDELKKKESSNVKKIEVELEYNKEKPKIEKTNKIVASLYKEKPKYTRITRNYGYVSRSFIGRRIPLPIKFIRPTYGIVTAHYGDSYSNGYPGAFHRGVDIGNGVGTPIYAAAAGVVVSSGDDHDGYGKCVIIDHGKGVKTVYAHCSRLLVDAGQTVTQGQQIAKMGHTGFAFGTHLHFEVHFGGELLNPEYYI